MIPSKFTQDLCAPNVPACNFQLYQMTGELNQPFFADLSEADRLRAKQLLESNSVTIRMNYCQKKIYKLIIRFEKELTL